MLCEAPAKHSSGSEIRSLLAETLSSDHRASCTCSQAAVVHLPLFSRMRT